MAAELAIMDSAADVCETSRFRAGVAVVLVASLEGVILESTGDVSCFLFLVGTAVALGVSVVLAILGSTGEISETSQFSDGSAATLLSKVSNSKSLSNVCCKGCVTMSDDWSADGADSTSSSALPV